MDDFLRSDGVFRRFVESLIDYAVVILDTEGQCGGVERRRQRDQGISAAEVLGGNFAMFYPPEARLMGHPQRELSAAEMTGRYEEEGWRLRKDGSRFWAHVIITPIFDEAHVLRGFGKVVRDFTERKQVQEQADNVMKLLEFTARTDYLTGLDNRRAFDMRLTAEVSAARRHGRPLCLAMIDLDRFKAFNDGHGHQAGDRFLKQATDLWRRGLRAEDFIARYGGEEFIVLVPNVDVSGAALMLERLRGATPAPLTCSVGLAQWDGVETPDAFLGRADRALYQAKATGRDRIVIADIEARPSIARLPTPIHIVA